MYVPFYKGYFLTARGNVFLCCKNSSDTILLIGSCSINSEKYEINSKIQSIKLTVSKKQIGNLFTVKQKTLAENVTLFTGTIALGLL